VTGAVAGLRVAVAAARRVVVKVGSSSIVTPAGGLDAERVRALVTVLADQRDGGREVVLVSSGAIAAGLGPLGLTRRPRDLPTLQAAASVGQGQLVACYAAAFGARGRTVAQVLLTADDVTRRAHYRNARTTLERLLELGVVPVVNENDAVATEEIRLGDNDRLGSLVAHLVSADLLVLLSDVDGLYDADPRRPGARLVQEVRGEADLAGVTTAGRGTGIGTGGMATKVAAAIAAAGAGVTVVVTDAPSAGAALGGEPVGTVFHPTGDRISSRLLWLAHATVSRGALRLDPGAVAAVVGRRLSLLPAGVVAAEGEFAAGDPVDLVDDASGRVVARGLVAYDAAELPRMLGRSTRDLGSGELVHRDDLVLLHP